MKSENDDEVVIVELPRWKVKMLDKIAEERQAYDLITSKLKNLWIWTVVAGVLSIWAFWDMIKVKVGN